MRKLFLTLFYSGLSPKAPGTVGSLLALIMALLLLQIIDTTTLLLLSLLITAIAVKQIDIYEKEVGRHDGKEIVIDELAGMWLALCVAGINDENFYVMAGLCFVYFRLFDIWKPSLIGKIDRDVKGGWGVMGDDLLAGLFAGICSAGTYYLYATYIL